MSGVITPILDTLLHEVLGRRAEAPLKHENFEPIKPMLPRQASKAVHSDSRLNTSQAGGGQALESGAGRSPGLVAQELASPTPSARTHFSPAARSIADVLVKFPAPPSILRSPVALMPEAGGGEPTQVAARLQQSIETSGLFYESHLGRWYRGELPRTALEREPQMQLFRPLAFTGNGTPGGTPASPEGFSRTGVHAGQVGSASLSPLARGAAEGARPANALAPVAAPSPMVSSSAQESATVPAAREVPGGTDRVASSPVDEAGTSRRAAAEGIEHLDDTLHGLVRHQLELLVNPVLRWEGDVWSGVFMALVVHLPDGLPEHGEPSSERDGKGAEDDGVWHSELTLSLPRLGALTIDLYLRHTSLNLTLRTSSEAGLNELKAGSGGLQARLQRCGFDEVKISVLPARDPDEADS
ncbi:MAG: flagellar hook-length control protein FliK [Halomonas sp.]|nr:flagellar hook-length control protein FliK [Halomonas sp.]